MLADLSDYLAYLSAVVALLGLYWELIRRCKLRGRARERERVGWKGRERQEISNANREAIGCESEEEQMFEALQSRNLRKPWSYLRCSPRFPCIHCSFLRWSKRPCRTFLRFRTAHWRRNSAARSKIETNWEDNDSSILVAISISEWIVFQTNKRSYDPHGEWSVSRKILPIHSQHTHHISRHTCSIILIWFVMIWWTSARRCTKRFERDNANKWTHKRTRYKYMKWIFEIDFVTASIFTWTIVLTSSLPTSLH